MEFLAIKNYNMYTGFKERQNIQTETSSYRSFKSTDEYKKQEEERRKREEEARRQAEEQARKEQLVSLVVEEKKKTWQEKVKGVIGKVGGFIKEKYEEEKSKPVLQRIKELPTGGPLGEMYKEKSQAPLATLLRTGSLKETGKSTLAAAKRSISPFDEERKLTNIMGVGMISGGLKRVGGKAIGEAGKKINPLIQEARKYKLEENFIANPELKNKNFILTEKNISDIKPSQAIGTKSQSVDVAKKVAYLKKGNELSPIVIDESGNIINGNRRYEAMLKTGKEKIKVFQIVGEGDGKIIKSQPLQEGGSLIQEAKKIEEKGRKAYADYWKKNPNGQQTSDNHTWGSFLTGQEQSRLAEINSKLNVEKLKSRGITTQQDIKDIVKIKRNLRNKGIQFNENASKQELTDIWNKSQPLQEGGIKAVKPAETILSKPEGMLGQKATLPAGQKVSTLAGGKLGGGGQLDIPQGISYEDSDLVKTLAQELKKVKPMRGEQEILYTKARGEKLAKMMQARGKMAGEKGFFAEKGALAGELPKIQYEPLRQKFSQENVDQLFNMVKKSEALNEWDKLSAQEGLAKILGEKGFGLPTRNEIEKMHQVFGKDFTETLLSKRPFFVKLKEAGLQAYNLPRTLMAGVGDFSATLMQNLVFAYRHPVITAKNFTRSLKYFANDDYYKASMQEIAKRPNNNLYREAKLSFTDVSPIVSQREEQFMASWAEKIPGLGKVIKATGRSYTGFLNQMRADVADTIINVQKQLGNKIDDPRFLKSMGTFVNAGTGRGSLGALEKSGSILAQGFFSARKMVATFNLINPAFYIKASPVVRKEALKTMFAFFAGASTITGLAKLAGAEVSTDPTSADFMKIKIGNTRINLFGSYQQLTTLVARQLLGYQTSSTTGRRVYLGEGYKPLNRLQLFGRWLESKEHPTLSYISEAMKGEDEAGRKFKYGPEVLDRFMPMVVSDSYDLYKEHGTKGLWGIIPTMLGLPTQTYGKQVPIMEKTETGEEKLKLRGIPGLGEDIYNKLTGKQVSGIPKEEQQAIVEKEQAKSQQEYEHQEKMKEAKKRVFETGKYERVDDTIVYKEDGEIKTSQSEDIVRLKPTYKQVQTLIKEDKRGEAQTIVNKLSKEDYEAYKKVKSSENTKITSEFKDKLESDPKEAVRYLRSLEKEHQDRILKNMSDEEYEIYKSGK